MRLIRPWVLAAAMVLVCCTTGLGDGVRRYYNQEVRNLYASSLIFFDRGDYRQAEHMLGRLGSYQLPLIPLHREALSILWHWQNNRAMPGINKLIAAGVPDQALFMALSDQALENHRFEVYRFCAIHDTSFVGRVDRQIDRMLADYYRNRHKPFHTFKFLAKLVNRNELSLDMPRDTALIRERIGAAVETGTCRADGIGCTFPSSAVSGAVRAFVYGEIK